MTDPKLKGIPFCRHIGATAHDLLAADLVWRINTISSTGPYLAVPEVTVGDKNGRKGSTRFDIVALDITSGSVLAIEVKTSIADMNLWLKAERWKVAIEHGAMPCLAYPEALGYPALPKEVDHLIKRRSGDWRPIRIYHPKPRPSAELLTATLRVMRNNIEFRKVIAYLGTSLADALVTTGTEPDLIVDDVDVKAAE